jgi:hypothetical protein
MKYIIINILLLLSSISYSRTLIVHHKQDKRLILYEDSLRSWKFRQKTNLKHKKLLDNCITYDEYLNMIKALGYHVCNNKTSKNDKLMYDDAGIYYTHELLTCFHSKLGDYSCIYVPIVKKPKIKVIYKPERQQVYVSSITSNYIKNIKMITVISMWVKTDSNNNLLIYDMVIKKVKI